MEIVATIQLLDGCILFEGGGLIGGNKFVEQLINIAHITSHTMLQHIIGITLMAEKLSQFATHIDEPLTDLKVVLGIVVDTLGILGHIHLPAQLATGAVGHERRVGREVEREDPAFESLFLGRHGSSLASGLGQTFEVGLIGNMQGERLVLLQHVLRELQTQHRGFLGKLAQALLAFGIEKGTAAHESVVAVVEEHFLLRREFAMVTMHILDALEEPLVKADIVGVLREDRTHLLGQSLHLVVGLG